MPTIRRAGIEDIDQVIAQRMVFLREMHPEMSDPGPEFVDLTRKYVAEKLPTGEFLVWFAEEDGQIVGTGGLIFWHRPPTFGYRTDLHAYILNMYTLPEWRGKGVGTMLLQHVIDYVKTTPASRIGLQASDMGRPLYERFGFVASGDAMTLNL